VHAAHAQEVSSDGGAFLGGRPAPLVPGGVGAGFDGAAAGVWAGSECVCAGSESVCAGPLSDPSGLAGGLGGEVGVFGRTSGSLALESDAGAFGSTFFTTGTSSLAILLLSGYQCKLSWECDSGYHSLSSQILFLSQTPFGSTCLSARPPFIPSSPSRMPW
jgi:hypothetical protein